MKITIGHHWGGSEEFASIARYALEKLYESGSGGRLEAMDRTIDNIFDSYCRLLAVLSEKGLLTAHEVVRIVEDYSVDPSGADEYSNAFATFEKED